MEKNCRPVRKLAGAVAGVALALQAAGLAAQGEDFQFIIAVADAQGRPIADLRRDEILVSEQGIAHETVKIEPYRVPVTLTIAVDNGPRSGEALGHYRTGLAALVKALPQDVEVTLISIAPQPRMVVPPTTNRQRILRGVNEFAPEAEAPRFTDALVEFSQRLQRQAEQTRRFDSLPVLVMISTTASEAVSYQVPEISRALGFLQSRKAKVYITTLSTSRAGGGAAQINDNRQALIGIPATELTRGRYEALAASSRLTTLLPELGREIAALHRKHASQLLVTVRRSDEISGPVRNPRIEVARPGLTCQVSLDGLP